MPFDTRAHAVSQLAQTRQAIAQCLATQNQQTSTTGASSQRATDWGTPSGFVDWAWRVVVEKLLCQFTPARQPIRAIAALKTAQALLHAKAQTHPGRLVLGAALLGAGAAATRPWRWLKCSDVLHQLLAQCVTQALTNHTSGTKGNR